MSALTRREIWFLNHPYQNPCLLVLECLIHCILVQFRVIKSQILLTLNEYFEAPNQPASVSGVNTNLPIQISDNSTAIPSDTTPDSDSSPIIISTDSSASTKSDGQSLAEDVEEQQSENEPVEPESVNDQEIIPYITKWTAHSPISQIIGDPITSVRTRSATANECHFSMFLSTTEPTRVSAALEDSYWVKAMQEELNQFEALKVWRLVPKPKDKSTIGTKWIFKNKRNETGVIDRNKSHWVATGYR